MEKGKRGGGRSWFAVDSKSFEISISSIRGKLHGTILERSKGFSNWIRFGDSSSRCLLEGVEACCREEKFGKVLKSWEEEGRRFRLERRANEAGKFIICSVRDLEAKRFSLVFSEGRGILGGWVLLADKLRYLGVALHSKDNVGLGIVGAKEGKRDEAQAEEEEKNQSFVEVAKAKVGRRGDAVWLQLGGRALRSREEQLGRCLVGRWEAEDGRCPDLDCLRNWGRRLWNLKGGVCFSFLGGGFFLAEFEVAEEAERVLRRGNQRFQDRILHLESWGPKVGCSRPGVHADQC